MTEWFPSKELKREVAEVYPYFTSRERKKIAVLILRKQELEAEVARRPLPRSTTMAEIAALTWVLEELEAMEHDDSSTNSL